MLTGGGVDLSKIQVGEFSSDPITGSVLKSEATFSFTNFSTDELMNTFTVMIQREKFRIQSVNITRNAETELLQGNFHAIHYSAVSQNAESE
jgi:hypothetical protein